MDAFDIEGRNPNSGAVVRLRLIAESRNEAKRLAERCGLVSVTVRPCEAKPGPQGNDPPPA